MGQTVGVVPLDHKLIQTKLEPSQVIVKGPRSLLENMKSVRTSVFNLDNLTESGRFSISVIQPDQRVVISEKTIDALFEVETTRSNMVIKDMPIYFLTPSNIKKSSTKFANLVVL